MANAFQRFPQVGGDINIGGDYNEFQLESLLGVITSQLYNDGGALKLKVGRIGIDNGTTKGAAILDTVETIDLSGVSNETWAKIEMAISGTAPVFTAADIAGATDPAEAPATFKNSYNGLKGGFYIDTAKRCIGLAWKNSSGVLLAIINVCPHINDFWASEIGLHTGTIQTQDAPRKGFQIELGDWNMDTNSTLTVSTSFGAGFGFAVKSVETIIRSDVDNARFPLELFSNAADPNLLQGAFTNITATGDILLARRTGGYYDGVLFDSLSYNRGWLTIYLRDF